MLSNSSSRSTIPSSNYLSPWFRHDHLIYILDSFDTLDELNEFSSLLEKISQFALRDQTDIRSILATIPAHSKLIAKISKINNFVLQLKAQHKAVIRYSHQKHVAENQQEYAGESYTRHLNNVKAVLREFGFGPKDSIEGLVLGSAALIHDVIEDTDATYEEIEDLFSSQLARIVLGVTKLNNSDKDQVGLSPEDILKNTYRRTRTDRLSVALKLADRISNVRQGLADFFLNLPSKVSKYMLEQKVFKEILYRGEETELQPMWDELDRLLSDPYYALHFVNQNRGRRSSKIPVDKSIQCREVVVANNGVLQEGRSQ
ncbi:MAG: HD domain-containing protein [Bdellovibrionales bacterium]|nr:HD domain-containing protein [Bdellovibrionales bacterium]